MRRTVMGFIFLPLFSLTFNVNQLSAVPLFKKGKQVCEATDLGQGQFMTAAHCVAGSINLAVGPTAEPIIVTEIDENLDLALLSAGGSKIGSIRSFFVPVDSSKPLYFANKDGTLSQVLTLTNNSNVAYFHSAHTVPGDSGSGLFQDGKLVGIHVGMGDPERLDMRIGMFINPVKFNPSLVAMNYTKQGAPVALTAAVAWCELNKTACATLGASAVATLNFTYNLVLEYWKANLAQGNNAAPYKEALEQCEKDKDQIINEIGNKLQGPISSGIPDTITPSSNFDPEIEILNLDNVPPGGGGTSEITEYDTGMHCTRVGHSLSCYTPFDSQITLMPGSAKYLFLSRIAIAHALYSAVGREPTQGEANSMAIYLLGRRSLESAAKMAANWNKWEPSDQPCGIGAPCSGDGTPL